MGRVLVTRRLPDGGLDPLAGHEIVGPKADDAPYTHDELCTHVRSCDAIVCLLTDRIDATVIEGGASSLRVIVNVAVGYDNVDVQAAAARALPVCNTSGVPHATTTDPASSALR